MLLIKRFFFSASKRKIKKENKPRQLAFRGIQRLNQYESNNQIWEATAALLQSRTQTIFSSSPYRNQIYQTVGIKTIPNEKEAFKSIRPISYQSLQRPEIWNVLLRMFAKKGLYRESQKIYKLMKLHPAEPTAETFSHLLESCLNRLKTGIHPKNPEKNDVYQSAFTIFDKIPQPLLNRYHVNYLLKCCSIVGDWQKLFQLYKEMNHVESPIRKKQMLSLEKYAKQNNELEEDTEVEKEEKELKPTKLNFIQPDQVTYSILLSACAQRGGEAGLDDALKLWQHLKKDIEFGRSSSKHRESFLRSQSKRKNQKKNIFLSLDEKQHQEWDLLESSKEKQPLLQLDTELVNSFLHVCQKSQTQRAITSAFSTVQEEFGQDFDWRLFHKFCLNQTERKINFFSIFKKLKKEETEKVNPNIRVTIHPNSKTLFYLMQLLEQKNNLDHNIIKLFFEFFTEKSEQRPYKTVKPDALLSKYYERIQNKYKL